ncbi:MAG TPA: BadF/BadG/BcrA/BcrD ATPase family protein [Actinotalea sp.]
MGALTVRGPGVVVAVDGGGTKTDVVALGLDGTLLARRRGPGACPQVIGVAAALAVVDALVEEVLADIADGDRAQGAEGDPAVLVQVGVYLSGLDLEVEIEAMGAALADLPWVASCEQPVIVENDTFALLRAGTASRQAVAVVCGTGINCVARREDGATARFPALGRISGDWGGGWELGERALWHAARAADGRGPVTSLTTLIPEALGRATLMEVIEDLHLGRLPTRVISTLAPLVLAASAQGDPVAGSVVDRQGDEIVALVGAALRRLDLTGTRVPVVLGGGVLAARDPRLTGRIEAGLALAAPQALPEIVTAPPVLGAALLVLEACGAPPTALVTARETIGAHLPGAA